MNILIISSIRCGGHYFMTQLADTYNLRPVHEPKKLKSIDEFNKKGFNGVCVKILTDFPTEDILKIVEYSKKFDYVFLLNRRNSEEQFKSIYVVYQVTQKITANWSWDIEYEKLHNYKSKEIEYKQWIEDKSNALNNISELLGIEVLYYEDLYYNTKVCNLQGLEFNPDKSKKLFSESNEKTII